MSFGGPNKNGPKLIVIECSNKDVGINIAAVSKYTRAYSHIWLLCFVY